MRIPRYPRLILKLMDETGQDEETILLLIGLGAAEACEFALRDMDGVMAEKCKLVYQTVKEIRTNGENQS